MPVYVTSGFSSIPKAPKPGDDPPEPITTEQPQHGILGRTARERLGETKRTCTGTNKNGERCLNAPIVGGFVCVWHGGGAPQVRAAARERMYQMLPRGLDVVDKILTNHAKG